MRHIFAQNIEQWYEENQRKLPWRQTQDPYRIWISEIILQQTRVAQGYPYYMRFIERFPDVEALAMAEEDDVLLYWQGLGYYTRARNLHKAAKLIAQQGGFPTEYSDIRALPGIGDYTAAAIASFAFGLPYAVLDGNVYRVLSRYLGEDTPINTTKGKKLFRALADEMLDKQQPALYNQSIMDFGAQQCMPVPRCVDCPLMETCTARREGRAFELPVKIRSTKVRPRYLVYIYVRAKGVLLHRREEGDIWQGLYEPLLLEVSPEDAPTLTAYLQSFEGMFQCLITGRKHQLSHQLLVCDFYLLEAPNHKMAFRQIEGLIDSSPCRFLNAPISLQRCFWTSETTLHDYPAPRLVLELYKKLTFHG